MIPIGAGDSPAAAAADLTWQLRLVGLARAAAAADLTRQLRLVGLALRILLSLGVKHSPTSIQRPFLVLFPAGVLHH